MNINPRIVCSNTLDAAHPADTMLMLKAQVAELETLVEIERQRLIALGVGAHDGIVARATVNEVTDRTKIEWQKIAEALKPSLRLPRDKWSEQMVELVNGYTKPVTPYFTVKVVARIAA